MPSSNDSLALKYEELATQVMAELGVVSETELPKFWLDASLEPEVRARACVAAGFLRMKTAMPIMLELANSEIAAVAWGAANALALIGSRAATRPLMQIVRHSAYEPARNAAINALGRLHDARAEGLICEVLTDQAESESTRTFAACALMNPRNPKRAIVYLLRALDDPSAHVRWQALSALGTTGNPDVAEAIRRCLADQTVVPGLPAEEATVASAAKDALANLLGR
jgi:HEAT repeat protein